MEAAGIEPASRDVSVPASTCVVAVLDLAWRARGDTIPSSPARPDLAAPVTGPLRGGQPASDVSPTLAGAGRGRVAFIRQPLPEAYWQLKVSQGFNEATWNLGTPPTPQLVRSKPFRPRMKPGVNTSIVSAEGLFDHSCLPAAIALGASVRVRIL